MTVRKKRRSRSVTADMADGDLQGGQAAASVLKGQLRFRKKKRKEKTTPFGVSLMTSQVLYRAAPVAF